MSQVLIEISNDYHLPDDQDVYLNDDDSLGANKHTVKKEQKTGYRKPIDVWEIDLHIEEITDSHAGLSNFEILNKQLKEFKNFFNRAKSKRIRKIVVIHGVGEGVLKEEIRIYLSKQEGVEYFDADFRDYGKGATAAEIHYNI
ncbi:MAG: Smr/MutS family protein [Flavobacteriia bacterium]|nr:Smr/MutS family protein [Flavobacteriia bacterium]